MTHSGGKPHAVGDLGQRYEVSFLASEGRQIFGWARTLAGAGSMVRAIELHPVWHSPLVLDRETKSLIPLELARGT